MRPAHRSVLIPVLVLATGSFLYGYLEDLDDGGRGSHSTFHYEFTRVLARAAGFSGPEAELIAVACQATDSADFTGETGVRVRISGTDRLEESQAKYWHFPRRGTMNYTGEYPHPGSRSTCDYFGSTSDPCPAGLPETSEMEAWAVYGFGTPAAGTPAGVVGDGPLVALPGRSLLALGIYVHGLADSYSHEKCMEETQTRRHDTSLPIAKPCTTTIWHLEAEYGGKGEGYPFTVEAGRAVWLALSWYRQQNSSDGPTLWGEADAAAFSSQWAAEGKAEDRRSLAVSTLEVLNRTQLYFAQFGDGRAGSATLSSVIVLLNPTSNPVDVVEVRLKKSDGTPMTVDINGKVTEGVIEGFSLPPFGASTLRTDGEGDLQVGTATVISTGSISGEVLFGGSVGLAGVGASAPGTCFLVPALNGSNGATGIAVMSTGSQLSLNLELRNREGVLLATSETQLTAGSQRAVFLSEIDWVWPGEEEALEEFTGSVRVQGSADLALTTILSTGKEFATLPVVPCN